MNEPVREEGEDRERIGRRELEGARWGRGKRERERESIGGGG